MIADVMQEYGYSKQLINGKSFVSAADSPPA
jgi:hypothetical protein